MSNPICGFLIATSKATRSCPAAWGCALGAGEVKFTGEVGPDVKLVTYEIDIKRVIKRKLCMAIGDARLLADGKEIYVCNDLRVGLFLREGDKAGGQA